jgi:muramoyltetrapeptide carboxypeptidase
MIQAPPLQAGDRVGITCPAGAIPIEKVQNIIKRLESWGYQVVVGETVGQEHFYFSAPDAVRKNELQTMMDDPSIRAIICARGGYGVSRIVYDLDFTKMKQYPKWVVGFSDITVLHAALLKNELVSVHGSMAAAFNKEEKGEPYVKSLQAILEGKKNDIECDAHVLNQKGIVTAPLIGGNLCLIAHLIGSSLQIDTKGKILFIEDIGETHYNVDRMLIQMKQAGMFHEVAGVIVGGFTDMKDKEDNFLGISINELIHSHLSNLQVPIAYGFPISHGLENYSVKEGATYRFEVNHDKVLLSAS